MWIQDPGNDIWYNSDAIVYMNPTSPDGQNYFIQFVSIGNSVFQWTTEYPSLGACNTAIANTAAQFNASTAG